MIIVSWYCETCDGAGYIEYPDYDYEENILDVGIRVECPYCGGGGINLIKRLASFITTFDIDRTVCGKVQCRLGGYDEYIKNLSEKDFQMLLYNICRIKYPELTDLWFKIDNEDIMIDVTYRHKKYI